MGGSSSSGGGKQTARAAVKQSRGTSKKNSVKTATGRGYTRGARQSLISRKGGGKAASAKPKAAPKKPAATKKPATKTKSSRRK